MAGGRNGLRESDRSAAGVCLTQDANTKRPAHHRNPDRRARGLQRDECRHESQIRLITADVPRIGTVTGTEFARAHANTRVDETLARLDVRRGSRV